METLLSKRSKNIIAVFILGIIGLIGLGLIVQDPENISVSAVRKELAAAVEKMDARITRRVLELEKRADSICDRFKRKHLDHAELKSRESLILENNGVVSEYYGEIFYFKFNDRLPDSWSLIRKNQDIYFVKKCDSHVYYVRFLLDIDENDYLRKQAYPFLEVEFKFLEPPLNDQPDEFQFDDVKSKFFYSHLLRPLNNQLMLFVKFSKIDLLQFFKNKRKTYIYLSILVFLLVGMLVLRGQSIKYVRIFRIFLIPAFMATAYCLVSMQATPDLFIHLSIGNIHSIYQVGILVLSIGALLVWVSTLFQNRLVSRPVSFLVFNGLAMGVFVLSRHILASLDFLYSDFNISPAYLMLLVILLVIHLIPFIVVRFSSKKVGSPAGYMVIAGFQLLAAASMVLGFGFQVLSVISLSLAYLVFLARGGKFLMRLLVLFLISVSIYGVIDHNALEEKKEFIARNLKPIFLNQSNYAKLIAREIVHEVNRFKDSFPDFFQEGRSSRLEAIWSGSLASQENIASGIFVLSKTGELKNSHSYLIPFLNTEPYRTFPLWAIEDSTAEIYGKKLSLAVATTSVFQSYDFLGRIIVQVLNSSDLILQSRNQHNIFSLNRKIDGSDLNYITLNEENQILENPANINLKNIAGIIKFKDEWIRFSFMNLNFTGYIFEQNNNAVIIFFPENSLLKELSELIRIFFLFSVLFLLVNLRELKNMQWSRIYYSFSIRVFVILMLISFLTAIIYSIFSADFYSRSEEIQARHSILERGRTAQNIGNNFVEESGELNLNQIFLLSAILNKDVSVYQHGELLFTSNYRKIIRSTIPVFLHSNILNLLNNKNQEFVPVSQSGGFSLYFKIYNYIFNIEFPASRKDVVSERRQYTNFIIVLFFLLLIVGVAWAFFFRNKIISPILELNRGMEEVERGNLIHLEEVPPEMELKSLYMGFNSMVDGIKEQKKSISEISRMKTLLKMGRRVAHEVKNPLTPIKLSAEQILRSIKDKREGYENMIEKSVHFIIDESEHLKKVSYGFLDFSRLDEVNPEWFDLFEAAKEEVASFKSLYPKIDFHFSVKGRDFRVCWDRLKIKQVVKNILINSIEAIGDRRGKIHLNLEEEAKRIRIDISDNGIGLDNRELELIFDEDYSTKEIGTGLGLFIVKRIVELHLGRIEIRSKKNRGTTVTLDMQKNVEKT